MKPEPWRLYMDDIRECPEGWELARSMEQAQSAIILWGMPAEMSLDHDMGLWSPDGMDFCKWLVDQDRIGYLNLSDCIITFHSANPSGRANMESLINNYLKFKRENNGQG
jgi:hypothetical protein